MVNLHYIYNLLKNSYPVDEMILNVVPVSGNSMRASNTINNNNIYNFIYEKIISLKDTKLTYINNMYSLNEPSKEFNIL